MNLMKMLQTTTLLSLFFIAFSGAQAEESSVTESKSKIEKTSSNKVDGSESADDILTNANLRAMSGSKSKWSISTSFTYDGGTLNKPFDENRPNIADASATSSDTDLNGTLSVKYNINTQNAVLLGFGIRKMAPFVSSGPSAQFYQQGGKDIDAFDPTLTYQYIYKMGIVQSVLQVGVTQYTRQDIQSADGGNLDKALAIDQENIIDIGDTGLSIGASIGAGENLPTNSGRNFSRYQIWLDPYLEYRLNDTFNLRTVSNLWTYEFYPVDGVFHDTVTQSVGLGISISRDIFLYPNVQFLPDHAQLDRTNVGITSTINLF
ncbi:MAG: hypothetical protein ACXVCY_10585 [Pseudobdellovibrionaceae bacterium]